MRGQRGRHRFRPTRPSRQAADSAQVAGSALGSAAQSAGSFSSSGPGSGPGRARPSSGLSWLAKMITPMPAVKPTVTGKGMNLT